MTKMNGKKSSIVDELKEKYQDRLARAQSKLKSGRAERRASKSDILLFRKWAYRVGKGWYGFDLGNIPDIWRLVLDEFLEWLEPRRPDFEIHQVKIKGRRLRLYLGTKTDLFIPDENIHLEISKLEHLLSLPESIETTVRKARKRRKHAHKPSFDSKISCKMGRKN